MSMFIVLAENNNILFLIFRDRHELSSEHIRDGYFSATNHQIFIANFVGNIRRILTQHILCFIDLYFIKYTFNAHESIFKSVKR